MSEHPSCCGPAPSGGSDATTRSGLIPRITTGSTDGMVHLPGGRCVSGASDGIGYPQDGEGPGRPIELSPFWIDACAVSNRQFAAFVDATGTVTEAERLGWSYVFHDLLHPEARTQVRGIPTGTAWWRGVDGATWKQPYGPGSRLRGLLDHPVVHVSWNDAVAYAAWAGKRLATEAEYEYAARGGATTRYWWGDELEPGGQHFCNVFQGRFPDRDSAADGWHGTCPVDAFPANPFGLYNVAGNVWEWTLDGWGTDRPRLGDRDPYQPGTGDLRVIRGGSYLCHQSYCNRYRLAARSKNTIDSATGNTGFRCVRDV